MESATRVKFVETPKVWAVGMVRDEADVIEYTLRHLIASAVDGIVVADNLSTDGTRDIILNVRRQVRTPIILIDDTDPAYYQSAKMTALLQIALRHADQEWPWIVPFDADEVLVCSYRVPFAKYLRSMPETRRCFSVPMVNYFPCYLDREHHNPFKRIVHRHVPLNTLPKVVFRGTAGITIQQGSHAVLDTDGSTLEATHSTMLKICHFPYRSAEHFVRKAINGGLAYQAANLPESEGAHWRAYYAAFERGGEAALVDWYQRYFHFKESRMDELVWDPAPILE